MPDSAPMDKKELLRRHFLLSQFEESDLDKLVEFSSVRRFANRQTIFQKGDPGDGMYGILSGWVKISTFSEDGREITLNLLDRGELFGEIAMLDGKERTADSTAMAPSELLFIDRRDFIPFLEGHPRLYTRMLMTLCERIRWTSGLIEDALFLGLNERLAKKILALANAFGERTVDGIRIDRRLSQQEFGNLAGSSRESINKLLKLWEQEGLIRLDHGHVVVLRPEDLEALIGYG